MAKKPRIYDKALDNKVPFLRGILVRDLQELGLKFSEAMDVASAVRDELDVDKPTTTTALKRLIDIKLVETLGEQKLAKYNKAQTLAASIFIQYRSGQEVPFSRSTLQQNLENCCLDRARAIRITNDIYQKLLGLKRSMIQSGELRTLVSEHLAQHTPRKFQENYQIWGHFSRQRTPLILMIGGVPGTGKSTIAVELATRLGIIRTQSTDMLREVMRLLLPNEIEPTLHISSFQGASINNNMSLYESDHEHRLLSGYQRQCEIVEVAAKGVIKRALDEQVSIILEGVHIRPSLRQSIDASNENEAITALFYLGVLKKDQLIKHFKGRSEIATNRQAQNYISSIPDIWQLQTALLSEADNEEVPIYNNVDRDKTITAILRLVMSALRERYAHELFP